MTVEWLAGGHGVPVSAYTVSTVRFGGERLLHVRREPAEGSGDPSSEVEWLLSGGGTRPQQADAEAPPAA
jgi:hypothetical protein